ncbi:hypothetical protein B9Z55_025320 [Caenorhabditis nigoni]|uniref:Uncharacterized protein n=2 Tax=Caenorhabditis nigoni TaxID=1611254 RepID=A0A2G5SY62_9PELO|nr:hypothetical protein B9Z55_025320 [Caenorhabditis nigoni]
MVRQDNAFKFSLHIFCDNITQVKMLSDLISFRTMSFCRHETRFCELGLALRPAKEFRPLECYLFGKVNKELVSQMVHHNNTYHNCDTEQQIGRLLLIIKERETTQNWQHNVKKIIDYVEARVQELWRVSQNQPVAAAPAPGPSRKRHHMPAPGPAPREAAPSASGPVMMREPAPSSPPDDVQ